MNDVVRQFRDFFVSLKLTVVLLVLGMILVFAATLDQVNLGIWAVQEKYFRSFFVMWRVGEIPVPVFPGGYFVGGLLLINLIAAHVERFKFTARKSGIFLTHLGLILLLIGELLSGLWQQDFQMKISEGETKNFAESPRLNELAITDTTDAAFDDVVAIPEALVARGDPIQHPKLPFKVVVKAYFPNSLLAMRSAESGPSLATTGIGQRVAAAPQPPTYKPDEQNVPAAFIELVGTDSSIGTWLVRVPTLETPFPPQTFSYAGHEWKIGLRPLRTYKPFALTLLKFSHDVYPGTDIPKNFSSRLHLANAENHDDREVLIYMNNPLRYSGLTFYQAGYDGEHTTVLQVVRNPSWQLPYFACALMSLGLVIQFCIHLFAFIGKRRTAVASA
jgi:hypothetical protein